MNTDWIVDAACIGHDLFFDTTREADAKAICGPCAVREQCLDYALEHVGDSREVGVWGGLAGDERAKLRRKSGRGPVHGTVSRYVVGCRCDECLTAGHAYYQDRRKPIGVGEVHA